MLAEIAANPDRIARLSGQVAAGLGAAFAALAASCALRAVTVVGGLPVVALPETLGLDEAAAMLGIQPSTLRHRAQRAPYADLRVHNGTRRLRFSAGKIRAYLEPPDALVRTFKR